MKNNDTTIVDGEFTTVQGPEEDNGETMPDVKASQGANKKTVPDGDFAVRVGESVVIEKGASFLGTYRVDSDAIQGGMGKVWKVRHTGWNVDLAMKQPKTELFQSERQKETFIHECEAWIDLGLHPQIVSCYYVREIGGIPSIFAEWMDGGSLKSWIADGRLYKGSEQETLKRVLDIAIQFERGLHYAHENGLIHQDVKPDNVLLTANGEAKVADFGIARARAILTAQDIDVPVDGTIVSASGAYTPAYCSMEQLNGEVLSRRTDIYSWAVSVLEMFLGERPWQSGAIVGEACEDYFEMDMRISLPEEMKIILRSCLNGNPDARPHDFFEIDEDLLFIYAAQTGNPYPRERSKAASDTADSLNNRALSFLDLGKPAEAQQCWEHALKITPNHGESVYNYTVYRVKNGFIDFDSAFEYVTANTMQNNEVYLAEFCLAFGASEYVSHLLRSKSDLHEYYGQTYIKAEAMIKRGEGVENTIRLKYDDYQNSRYFAGNACFHSGAKLLLTPVLDGGFFSGRVDLWDFVTGEKCGAMHLGGDFSVIFLALCFSPDASKMLLGGEKGIEMAYIRDSRLENRRQTLNGGEGCRSACFSPDGTVAVSGHGAGNVYVWDSLTAERQMTLTGHKDSVRSVCFSADGSKIVTGSSDQTIRIWNSETGECLLTKEMEGSVGSVCVSPDCSYILVDCGGHISQLDFVSGESIADFYVSREDITAIHFHPDGSRVLFVDQSKSILWDIANRQFLCTYGKFSNTDSMRGYLTKAACFNQNGDHVYNVDSGGFVSSWPVPQSAYPADMILSTILSSETVIQTESLVNTLSREINDCIHSGDISCALEKLNELGKLPSMEGGEAYHDAMESVSRFCVKGNLLDQSQSILVKEIHWSYDENIILTSDHRGKVDVRDAKTGQRIHSFEMDYIKAVGGKDYQHACLSADGKKAAACGESGGSEDRLFKIWETRDGKCLHTIHVEEKSWGGGSWIEVLNFSPDGKLILASNSKKILIWDTDTGACRFVLDEHKNHVAAAVFSPDGRFVVSGDLYGCIKIWSIKGEKCKCIHTYENTNHTYDGTNQRDRHIDPILKISCIRISPDGNQIAVSGEHRIQLWGIDGQYIQSIGFVNLTSKPDAFRFFPDGRRMLLCDEDRGEKMMFRGIGFPGASGEIKGDYWSPCFNADGTACLAVSKRGIVLCRLDWELTFPGWAEWDDGALPYAKNFLALHPDYSDADFESFICDLQNHGYGWLRPEGVRNKIDGLQRAQENTSLFSRFKRK